MTFKLPPLPFAENELAPFVSKETIEYHYGKHHKNYVDTLNKLILGTEFAEKNLEDIIKSSSGPIFNNAGQVWNHNFYWQCLRKSKSEDIAIQLRNELNQTFGSIEKFKEEFTKVALGLFGSGWAWLVRDQNDSLVVVSTSNADNPLTKGSVPLLTCDVWEHAYYIDYRNARAKYLDAFWQVVNWQFVNDNFTKSAA